MTSDKFSGAAVDEFYCKQFSCGAGNVRPLDTRNARGGGRGE